MKEDDNRDTQEIRVPPYSGDDENTTPHSLKNASTNIGQNNDNVSETSTQSLNSSENVYDRNSFIAYENNQSYNSIHQESANTYHNPVQTPYANAHYNGFSYGDYPQKFNNSSRYETLPNNDSKGNTEKSVRRTIIGSACASALVALIVGGTAGFMVSEINDKDSATTPVIQTIDTDKNAKNNATSTSSTVDTSKDWGSVIRQASQSVVSITINVDASENNPAGQGYGSGVIASKSGYIVTNNHVVDKASKISITLNDGTVHKAKVVGKDSTTDIAVLKLEDTPSNLVPATFADSDDVSVGDNILAIGNPLGLSQTSTTGIVSALDRPVTTSSDDDIVSINAIQIDAAVNPGNSGGPLFNDKGEVIGITSSIASMSNMGADGNASQSGSIGLGFAIPSDQVEKVSNELLKNGKVSHAYLGVYLQNGSTKFKKSVVEGASVKTVEKSTPAAKAGLKAGDVVVKIDDNVVRSSSSLTGFVREYSVGDTAKLTYVRNGVVETADVTFSELDEKTS